MKIDDLLKQPSEWLKGAGPDAGIVISSRMRLARNIKGFTFSDWADDKTREAVKDLCKRQIASSNFMKNALYAEMDKISPVDNLLLLERHLISREHLNNPSGKAVFVSEKEIISVMINEEDHLRIQVLQSGLNLISAWDILKALEKDLEAKLDFAYSEQLGYLTACPTNVGTGMRASVMFHLPAVVMTRQIKDILEAISKLGLTVRGFFGEGTEAIGNFFQVSNQVTLGHREADIISNLERVVKQLIAQEENSRKFLIAKKREQLEDRIFRAYATLKNAHVINSEETLELLSLLRLGVETDIIKDVKISSLNEIFIIIQPAHLQKMRNKKFSSQERDIERAKLIRNVLGGNTKNV
ncbi:MAG: protein arginine kinase [Candidatus Omnitrophica bacterium]|nr:protein arginine kinase [Candidatus Omnitrophota bacterium]